MTYYQINIATNNLELQEILIALLADNGYESFEQTENSLQAYITETLWNEEALRNLIVNFSVTYTFQKVEQQNWNAIWESNFSPVWVENFVGIRASFHQPLQQVQHEIIITPKMSFGTGHHATTYSVIQLMQKIDFTNKKVFDFGTGTGILAIVAEKLGAKEILAVDNDDWCITNSEENIVANNCSKIKVQKSNNALVNDTFNIVIANINRNIIEDNLHYLHKALQKNGEVILSGLLTTDEADIVEQCVSLGWQHIKTISNKGWIAILLKAA